MADVWKRALLLLVVTASAVAAASAHPADPGPVRAVVRGGLSIRLAPGWQLRRGWLSDVIEPIPRLAVASFPVRLSRRTCECGMPNVRGFPRNGAFLFMWEYPHPSPRELAQVAQRPAHFRLGSGSAQRFACQGPDEVIGFRDAGRVFQAEIYLGPAAGPGVRARLLATLDSLRVAPAPGRRGL